MSWAALFERAAAFEATESAVREALARRREEEEPSDREEPDQ